MRRLASDYYNCSAATYSGAPLDVWFVFWLAIHFANLPPRTLVTLVTPGDFRPLMKNLSAQRHDVLAVGLDLQSMRIDCNQMVEEALRAFRVTEKTVLDLATLIMAPPDKRGRLSLGNLFPRALLEHRTKTFAQGKLGQRIYRVFDALAGFDSDNPRRYRYPGGGTFQPLPAIFCPPEATGCREVDELFAVWCDYQREQSGISRSTLDALRVAWGEPCVLTLRDCVVATLRERGEFEAYGLLDLLLWPLLREEQPKIGSVPAPDGLIGRRTLGLVSHE